MHAFIHVYACMAVRSSCSNTASMVCSWLFRVINSVAGINFQCSVHHTHPNKNIIDQVDIYRSCINIGSSHELDSKHASIASDKKIKKKKKKAYVGWGFSPWTMLLCYNGFSVFICFSCFLSLIYILKKVVNFVFLDLGKKKRCSTNVCNGRHTSFSRCACSRPSVAGKPCNYVHACMHHVARCRHFRVVSFVCARATGWDRYHSNTRVIWCMLPLVVSWQSN